MIVNAPQHLAHQVVLPVSSKGQVTLPIGLRRRLLIDKTGKVELRVKPDGSAQLLPAASGGDLASLAGAAGQLKRSMNWKQVRKVAWEKD